MDLELVEPHPRRVLEAFRQGDFDGLEILGQADEKAFFELCLQEKMLETLADSMPTARKKAEVPKWFVLGGSLSLQLHGEHAFQAFERWQAWFNGAVQGAFQQYGFFDPAGWLSGMAAICSSRTIRPMRARGCCGLMRTNTRSPTRN